MDTSFRFLVNPLSTFGWPILVVLVVFLFWWRTGSIYALLERVWRIFAGKAEVSDKILKSLIKESRDVEKFNFMYGFKVQTLDELRGLAEWLRINSVGVGLASRARQWIKTDPIELIPPPWFYQKIFRVAFWGFGVVGLMFALLAASPKAIFETKESQKWFLADAKGIKAVNGNWVITQQQCGEENQESVKKSGLLPAEISEVCGKLENNTFEQTVTEVIHEQVVFGVLYGLFFLAISVIFFAQFNSVVAAEEISNIMKRSGKKVATDVLATPAISVVRKRSVPQRTRKDDSNSTNGAGEPE
jgi:hypothetical protein